MSPRLPLPKLTQSACLVICTVILCGCMGIQSQSPPALDAAKVPVDGPSYYVHMKSGSEEPKVFEGPLEESLTIQQALEKSGAIERFRHMDVVIMREVPGRNRPLKLPVTFNPERDRVDYKQNYAVHANDRILVTPKNNSPFERWLHNVVQ